MVPREISSCGQCDKPVSAAELSQLDEGSVDDVGGLVGVAGNGLEDLTGVLPSVRSELGEHGQGVDPVVHGELHTVQDVVQSSQFIHGQWCVRDVDIRPIGESGSDRGETIIEEFAFDLECGRALAVFVSPQTGSGLTAVVSSCGRVMGDRKYEMYAFVAADGHRLHELIDN